MRGPVPIKCWAIENSNRTSRWIMPFTIRRTKREAIAAWMEIWPRSTWSQQKLRGCRAVRVMVSPE